jgi:hypothetical protein
LLLSLFKKVVVLPTKTKISDLQQTGEVPLGEWTGITLTLIVFWILFGQ